jgi:hypothetical protein
MELMMDFIASFFLTHVNDIGARTSLTKTRHFDLVKSASKCIETELGWESVLFSYLDLL